MGHTKASDIMFPSMFYKAAAQEYRWKMFKLPRTVPDPEVATATPQAPQCHELVHGPRLPPGFVVEMARSVRTHSSCLIHASVIYAGIAEAFQVLPAPCRARAVGQQAVERVIVPDARLPSCVNVLDVGEGRVPALLLEHGVA